MGWSAPKLRTLRRTLIQTEKWGFKGEVSREFDVILKPKNVCLSTETNKILSSFVINFHPSTVKLVIGTSDQRQCRLEWIEI